MEVIIIMIIYVVLSIVIGLNLIRKKDNKDLALKKINIYLVVKLIINIAMAILVSLNVKIIIKNEIIIVITPGAISLLLSILDSITLYSTIKRLRNLSCSKIVYYKQVIGDYLMLYLSWFAVSIFLYISNKDNDLIYMINYIVFWILINVITIIVRNLTLKAKITNNKKLMQAISKNKLDGFKIYEYDGKSRKTANAMVDSIFGRGNIYFSDYLIDNLTEEEVEAIYLHECKW